MEATDCIKGISSISTLIAIIGGLIILPDIKNWLAGLILKIQSNRNKVNSIFEVILNALNFIISVTIYLSPFLIWIYVSTNVDAILDFIKLGEFYLAIMMFWFNFFYVGLISLIITFLAKKLSQNEKVKKIAAAAYNFSLIYMLIPLIAGLGVYGVLFFGFFISFFIYFAYALKLGESFQNFAFKNKGGGILKRTDLDIDKIQKFIRYFSFLLIAISLILNHLIRTNILCP